MINDTTAHKSLGFFIQQWSSDPYNNFPGILYLSRHTNLTDTFQHPYSPPPISQSQYLPIHYITLDQIEFHKHITSRALNSKRHGPRRASFSNSNYVNTPTAAPSSLHYIGNTRVIIHEDSHRFQILVSSEASSQVNQGIPPKKILLVKLLPY